MDYADLKKRMDDTEEWLVLNAPQVFKEQRHLDAATAERAYWHYGYFMALKDAIGGFTLLGSATFPGTPTPMPEKLR